MLLKSLIQWYQIQHNTNTSYYLVLLPVRVQGRIIIWISTELDFTKNRVDHSAQDFAANANLLDILIVQ